MNRRLFIAINLDKRTKEGISRLVEEFKTKIPWELSSSIRFTPPENWHLTLSFLGYQDDEDIGVIMEAAQKAAKQFSPQNISLTETVYGPSERKPRMIWFLTDSYTEHNLAEIKNVLEDGLEEANVRFKREQRPFTGHLTLARLTTDFTADNLPTIGRDVHMQFEADGLDLMESELKRGGAEYTSLQKFLFK
ncbi:MAG: RNA 2',3'-cyclic phosphodiesterase [Patescibacteria group bacterium]|nr:RNA 2',3'-cyclic phosphodiesterase [Patescibacteria group bacterium]MDE2015746.1 RNA 2',3'-cyclic phosphodiesterase [Patescibacteria group bacterium]MDE2226803.1 RNA 2',3'-cyclic phosphodiesterase [Patescibacteria group bacterium]